MILEATTPSTPMCHSRLPATMVASLAGSKFFAAHSSASCATRRSTPCLSRLCWSSPAASLAASRRSSVRSKLSASLAGPRRPAALMRGPMRKPMSETRTGVETPATSRSAASPAQRVRSMRFNPCETKIRFSPTSGTMSATVASATKSRKSRKSSPSTGDAFTNACAILKTTPALQR